MIKNISTDIPFEFLISVNEVNHKWEFRLKGVACFGFSSKSFFVCSIPIDKEEKMKKHNLEYLVNMGESREEKGIFEKKKKKKKVL